MTRLTSTALFAAALAVAVPIQPLAREGSRLFASGSALPQADPIIEARDTLVQDTGAAMRIRLADRMRTLSQEIPSAACHLHNGIDAGANRSMLETSLDEFDVILDALLNGNVDLGIIGAEARRKTIDEIGMIRAEFAPIEQSARRLLEDPTRSEDALALYAVADPLLETTAHLLSELEGEYANPTEILQADVMLLEISGRQAMATQRLAFEACLIWSGEAGPEDIADMQGYVTRFDLSVRALLDGRPELGINPAPTDEIRIALEAVISDWDETEAALQQVIDDQSVPEEMASFICRNLKKKMDELEEIVDLYTDYSRRAY